MTRPPLEALTRTIHFMIRLSPGLGDRDVWFHEGREEVEKIQLASRSYARNRRGPAYSSPCRLSRMLANATCVADHDVCEAEPSVLLTGIHRSHALIPEH